MVALRSLIVGAFAALFGAAAAAGYAYPTPPPTWGGSPGAWTYGGTPAANAPWVNGSAAAQVTTQVGGRAVTVPATMRLSANAGSIVARAIRGSAFGGLAPAIAWAIVGGWVFDQALQLWTVPDPLALNGYWFLQDPEVKFASADAACRQLFAEVNHPNYVYHSADQYGTCLVTVLPGSEVGAIGSATFVPGQSGSVPRVPATDADADALPQAYPMPDEVARAADDVMPLPQEVPEIEPVSIPIGLPYPRNGEQWQDRIKVDPRNDTDSPWRVDQRIEAGPEDEASETPPEEQPADPCESYPERAGCKALGTLEPTPLPTIVAPLSITPDTGWAGGGSYACPQNKVLNLAAVTVVVPFTMLCDVADMARPVVIGVAWVVAVFGFMGLSKRD